MQTKIHLSKQDALRRKMKICYQDWHYKSLLWEKWTNLDLYSFATANHTATAHPAALWLKAVKLSKSWGGAKKLQDVRKSLPQVTEGPPLNRKNEDEQICSLWGQSVGCKVAIKKRTQDNSSSSESQFRAADVYALLCIHKCLQKRTYRHQWNTFELILCSTFIFLGSFEERPG